MRGTTTTGTGPAANRSGGAVQRVTAVGSSRHEAPAVASTARSAPPRRVATARADRTRAPDRAKRKLGSSEASRLPFTRADPAGPQLSALLNRCFAGPPADAAAGYKATRRAIVPPPLIPPASLQVRRGPSRPPPRRADR